MHIIEIGFVIYLKTYKFYFCDFLSLCFVIYQLISRIFCDRIIRMSS